MRKCEQRANHLFSGNGVTACILATLKQGEENAISSRQIQKVFGLNQRELRRIVETCRRKGVYILASDQGYFFPKDVSEIRRFIKRENSRIKNQCISITPLKRFLKELDKG